MLPAFLAEHDSALRPVLPGQGNFTRTFWMSMPAETKHLARMQAVWNFLRETVQERQSVLLLQPPGEENEASSGPPQRPARQRKPTP